MRVTRRLVTGFTIVLLVTVAVGAVGAIGMQRLLDSEAFVYDNHVRAILYAGEADAHLRQMQVENRNAIINSLYDDGKAADESRIAFESHAESFMLCMEKSLEISAAEEQQEFYASIKGLFENQYFPKARENIEAGISDIPGHHNRLYINAQLSACDRDAERIHSLLRGASDLGLALIEQSGLDNAWGMRAYTIALLSLLGFALIIAFLVSFLTIRGITKAAEKPAGSPQKAAGGAEARPGGSIGASSPKEGADSDGGRFVAPDARVLVVDDTHSDLMAAQVLMRPYNMKVDLVNSGVAAIQAVQFGRYDLVFIDHKMPGMDGVETALRIRKMGKSALPIVAMADSAVSGTAEALLENGFNDFLSKPINSLILDAMLRKWIPMDKRRYIPL